MTPEELLLKAPIWLIAIIGLSVTIACVSTVMIRLLIKVLRDR